MFCTPGAACAVFFRIFCSGSSMQSPLLVCVSLLVLLVSASTPAWASNPVLADSLFRVAIADTTRPLDEQIALMQQVLRADRHHADGLYALGCLYMAQNTVTSRWLARQKLEVAVRMDPGNVAYHTAYANLLRKQGFRYNSMRHFRTILELDPNNVHAACEIGEYFVQDMLKYVDARRFDGLGSMRSFGLESRDEAAAYFRQAIQKDPYCRRAYYRLGFLCLENGNPEGLVALSQELLRRYPGDRDGLLFLGLGCQETGQFEAADEAYREALSRMDEADRQVMESLGLLAGAEDRAAMGVAIRSEEASDWLGVPSHLLGRFWNRRDPLLLTSFNERRMAHYGRIAYAGLRFSLPDEGVAGWQTDMGKTYIRFGRYLVRERTIEPFREVWTYEDFQVSFHSYDSVHWRLDLLRDDRWVTEGGYGRGEVFSPDFHLRERYADPYAAWKYAMSHQIALFKAPDNHLKVRLAWAMPKIHLDYLRLYDTYQVDLREGITVWDEAGDTWERQRRRRDVLREVWQDTLKTRYLLSEATLNLPEGTFPLTVEVMDPQKETIGVFRDTLELEAFVEGRLGISSILLASRVSEDGKGEAGGGVSVIPNPMRTYTRSELLYLYFEIYNLTRDAFGQTHYRVVYRVGPPAPRRLKGELDRATRKRLGLDGDRWTISVSSEYRGNQQDEPLYLGVDLKELKAGLQLLSLMVTDELTGMQTGREVLFRIVE